MINCTHDIFSFRVPFRYTSFMLLVTCTWYCSWLLKKKAEEIIELHSCVWTLNLSHVWIFLQATVQKCNSQQKPIHDGSAGHSGSYTSDPILCKYVVGYLYFCSHSRGVGLGIPTRPWIPTYIIIQNCATNHVNISSREEATHIFRNMTIFICHQSYVGCCLYFWDAVLHLYMWNWK